MPAGVLARAAFALGYFGEDIGAMIALVDRALAFNPNFARGWHHSGILRTFAGQPNVATEHLEAAMRQSPHSLWLVARSNRLCAFPQPTLCCGDTETAPGDTG